MATGVGIEITNHKKNKFIVKNCDTMLKKTWQKVKKNNTMIENYKLIGMQSYPG